MTASRLISDLSSDPGGKNGDEWTQDTGDSVEEIWNVTGGLLATVTGVNSLVATLDVAVGFLSYTNGLRCQFIAPASNTTAATINIEGIGIKSLNDPDGVTLVAGAYVSGRMTDVVFVAADDAFRLVSAGGTTNIEVSGGIILQRSLPSRLVLAGGPSTALTPIGSQAFQCGFANSRVVLEGNVSRVTGAGTANVVGTVIALFVDTVQVETFTDHCEDDSHSSTAYAFEYEPGDISSHNYEIKVSSTITANYPVGSNSIVCSEYSPNS